MIAVSGYGGDAHALLGLLAGPADPSAAMEIGQLEHEAEEREGSRHPQHPPLCPARGHRRHRPPLSSRCRNAASIGYSLVQCVSSGERLTAIDTEPERTLWRAPLQHLVDASRTGLAGVGRAAVSIVAAEGRACGADTQLAGLGAVAHVPIAARGPVGHRGVHTSARRIAAVGSAGVAIVALERLAAADPP